MFPQAYHQLFAILNRLEHIEIQHLAQLLVHHVDFLQGGRILQFVVVLLGIFDDVEGYRQNVQIVQHPLTIGQLESVHHGQLP